MINESQDESLCCDRCFANGGSSKRTSCRVDTSQDGGAQYTSDDFRDELEKHNIECSMSGTGSCYDNAVAESFFGLLKRERTNRTRYKTRDEARADIFDYIEVFYNRKRRHGYNGNVSPTDFEDMSGGSL